MERNGGSDSGDEDRLHHRERYDLHAGDGAILRLCGQSARFQRHDLLARLAEILFRAGRRHAVADRYDQGGEAAAERGNRGNPGRRYGEARHRVCATHLNCLKQKPL